VSIGVLTRLEFLYDIEVFLRANPQGPQVALDFKYRKVFLSPNNDWPDEVGPVPYPMVPLLTDKMAANLLEKPLKSLIRDGS